MIFAKQLKNIQEEFSAIGEINKDLKLFDEEKFNETKFSSKNQAKHKKKMAKISVAKNTSDLLIPTMLIYSTINLVSGFDNAPVTGIDGVINLSNDLKTVHDYLSASAPAALPIIASLAGLSYSVANQLKNPSDIRFQEKELEQAKILKEFFKNDYLMRDMEESNILMMGYCFTDAIKKCKGPDRKMTPIALMRMGSLFNPTNDLTHYNKSNPSEYKSFSSIYKFTDSLLKEPELQDSLTEMLKIKKGDDESFTNRESVKFLSERMEKAFAETYKEVELEKTALITMKMLSRANSDEKSFTDTYVKIKKHFDMLLTEEIPLNKKNDYVNMNEVLKDLNEITTQRNLTEKEKQENRKEINKIFKKYKLGSNKSVLDRVKENYINLVKVDVFDMRLKVENSNKQSKKIQEEYKSSLNNKKEENQTEKMGRLVSLIKSSMLKDENDALEVMELKEAINPSKENKMVIEELNKQKKSKNKIR